MTSHEKRAAAINPRGMSVGFSAEARQAFAGLAAAVHGSEHFDPEMLRTVQEWAGGKSPTLNDVIICLPTIADQAICHIAATRDKKAVEAWQDIACAMAEQGYTITKDRVKSK